MMEWAKQLAKARLAPRCHHRKADGVRCGSPALHGRRFCYFHNRLRVRRDAPLNYLPPLEDANGIQSAIMEVARALLQNKIDRKTAGLLFYALQTASANLKQRVHFEPSPWLLLPNEGADASARSSALQGADASSGSSAFESADTDAGANTENRSGSGADPSADPKDDASADAVARAEGRQADGERQYCARRPDDRDESAGTISPVPLRRQAVC